MTSAPTGSVHVFSMHTSPLDLPGSGNAGGMNVYLAHLCRSLARTGWSVEVFTLAPSATPAPAADGAAASDAETGENASGPLPLGVEEATASTLETAPGCRVHLIDLPAARAAGKEDLPVFAAPFGRACAALAARLGLVPDVVHAHYWLSGAAVPAYQEALAERVPGTRDAPVVLTLHTSARVKNAHAGSGEPPEPEDRAEAEERMLRAAGAVIVNTRAEAEQLVELYGARPEALRVVEPGVDTEVFRPEEEAEAAGAAARDTGLPTGDPAPGREFRVVFAGRPQPLKGPEILIRCLAAVRRQVPGVRLEIRGTAAPDYLASLQELAREQGVAGICSFHPAARAEDLAASFRAADLVACPSSSETFGLVALEAQACGTPVAVSDVSGLRAATQDGACGHIVPERSPRAWAAALIALAGDSRYRQRLARAGLAHARTLTWDRAAERTEEIYRGLLETGPRHRTPDEAPGH